MKINLQPIISPSLPMTIFYYVIFFGIYMGFYWLYDFPQAIQGHVGTFAETLLPSKSLIANLVTFGVIVLNSMIIAQMNNRFAIIRTRTYLPTFIYLLLSVCWLPAYGNYVAALGATFALLALYLSLGMYKDKKSVEQAFLSFFFLALSSFLIPEFAVLTVIFWIGFAFLNSFSGKVFFASVFGFVTPWILFFSSLIFIVGHTDILPEVQEFVMNYSILNYRNIPTFLYIAIMTFILITSLVQIATNSRQDSIQTRNTLNFIKALIFAMMLLILFRYTGFASYMPFTALLFALLTAYIFTLLKNFFNSIVFIVLCAVNFIFAFYLLIISYLAV